jgi:hypothetical protein
MTYLSTLCMYVCICVRMQACMLWDVTWRKSVLLKVTILTVVYNMSSEHSTRIAGTLAEYFSPFTGQTLESIDWKRPRCHVVYEGIELHPFSYNCLSALQSVKIKNRANFQVQNKNFGFISVHKIQSVVLIPFQSILFSIPYPVIEINIIFKCCYSY